MHMQGVPVCEKGGQLRAQRKRRMFHILIQIQYLTNSKALSFFHTVLIPSCDLAYWVLEKGTIFHVGASLDVVLSFHSEGIGIDKEGWNIFREAGAYFKAAFPIKYNTYQ